MTRVSIDLCGRGPRLFSMTIETLRDNCQRILGYIETRSDGCKIGRDVYPRIKGYYDSHSNITKDASGVIRWLRRRAFVAGF